MPTQNSRERNQGTRKDSTPNKVEQVSRTSETASESHVAAISSRWCVSSNEDVEKGGTSPEIVGGYDWRLLSSPKEERGKVKADPELMKSRQPH